MKRLRRLSVCIAVQLVPFVAFAQCQPSSGSLCPPSTFTSVQSFIATALQIIVQISLPIIGFFLVLVGYKFIAAQGNSGKLQEARKSFLYVVIGASLVLGAWALSTLIGATVSELTGTNPL